MLQVSGKQDIEESMLRNETEQNEKKYKVIGL